MDVAIHQTAAGPIEVAVGGSGPAVLLIHGTPGSWRQCMPLAEDLAATHTVILPSRPGYGKTPVRSGRSIAGQADLYASLLDALGFDRAAIAGVSGGGPSTAAFAQRHPSRTTAVVLICAAAVDILELPRSMKVIAALTHVLLPLGPLVQRRRRRLLATNDADAMAKSELSESTRNAWPLTPASARTSATSSGPTPRHRAGCAASATTFVLRSGFVARARRHSTRSRHRP